MTATAARAATGEVTMKGMKPAEMARSPTRKAAG